MYAAILVNNADINLWWWVWVQYGGAASDVSMPRGEPRSGSTCDAVCTPGRCYGEHGRHCTVRGSGCHFHWTDERNYPVHWASH